jgi:hypothetical protein
MSYIPTEEPRRRVALFAAKPRRGYSPDNSFPSPPRRARRFFLTSRN